jgi:hypothetical protein
MGEAGKVLLTGIAHEPDWELDKRVLIALDEKWERKWTKNPFREFSLWKIRPGCGA